MERMGGRDRDRERVLGGWWGERQIKEERDPGRGGQRQGSETQKASRLGRDRYSQEGHRHLGSGRD